MFVHVQFAPVERRISKWERAVSHVSFCVEAYKVQVKAGWYFVHEHPKSATSWSLPEVAALAARKDVWCINVDQCMYMRPDGRSLGAITRHEHGTIMGGGNKSDTAISYISSFTV